MKDTSKLIKALEILARDVESNDGVAGYVRIKQSGVEVDPCFWIGRFSKPKRQGGE